MTDPTYDAPVPRSGRGRLGRPAAPQPSVPAFEPAEVSQGLAGAVLGALGRMQIRLDLMAKEQSDALAAVHSRVEALAESLDALVASFGRPGNAAPAGEPTEAPAASPSAWQPEPVAEPQWTEQPAAEPTSPADGGFFR